MPATEFQKRGIILVQLFLPQYALDAWDEIDQRELHHILSRDSAGPWHVMVPPTTPKFCSFVRQIEKNLSRCWDSAYGSLLDEDAHPPMTEQHLDVFTFGKPGPVNPSPRAHQVWLWVPLVPVSNNQGLPTFMEGSHRSDVAFSNLYTPTIRPGSALLFDARLATETPWMGGGVVFARAYDLEGLLGRGVGRYGGFGAAGGGGA